MATTPPPKNQIKKNDQVDSSAPIASECDETDSLKEDLSKPLRVLLYEKKYVVATVTVIMTSMSFIIAQAVRDIVTSCFYFGIDRPNHPRPTFESCGSTLLDETACSAVILICGALLIRSVSSSRPPTECPRSDHNSTMGGRRQPSAVLVETQVL